MVKKGILLVVCIVLVLALVSAFACSQPTAPATTQAPAPTTKAPASAPQKVIEWKLQSAFARVGGFGMITMPRFIENIDKKTNGKLKITYYDQNALVGANEIFGAVSKGAIEMGSAVGSYHAGTLPEGNFEYGLPMNVESQRQGYDLYLNYKGGEIHKILSEAYAKFNIKLLNYNFFDNALMTKNPIKSVADLKGLKVRAVGLAGQLMINVGASGISVPNAEIYTSLERGTCDALIMAPYSLKTQNYAEVVHYLYYPILFASPASYFVNMDAYKALPDEYKKILEDEIAYASLGTYLDGKDLPKVYIDSKDPVGNFEEREAGLVDIAVKAGKVTKGTLTPEMVKALRDGAKPIWDDYAAKSPTLARLVQLNRDYIAEKGLFK